MRVRATASGHYGEFYREVGDVFEISDDLFVVLDGDGQPLVKDGKVVRRGWFTKEWMEKVGESTPETPIAKPVKRSPLEVLKNKQAPPANTLADVTEAI